MNRTIVSVDVFETEYPLTKPYQLSFVSIHEFKSIGVEILLDNGKSEKAEVVPLEGYSEESYEFVLRNISDNASAVVGMSLKQARKQVLEKLKDHPFSSTALLTAIDQFDYSLISREGAEMLETLIPFSSDQLISGEVLREFFKVGKTYKLKLTGNQEKDIKALDMLETYYPLECTVRADANQAYNMEEARKLLEHICTLKVMENVEYFEQLLPLSDWSGQKRLVELFPDQNFMLDEPIIDNNKIDRAVDCGVQYVKLKLYKQGGIMEVLAHAQYANEKGLKVIFGNGVASWLSNQVELTIFSTHRQFFSGVHEANGYLKIKA